MATAVLKESAYPNGRDNTQRRDEHDGTCTLTGTYTTNGVPIGNASGAWVFAGAFGGTEITSSQNNIPINGSVKFYSLGGSLILYLYDYVHFTLRILVAGTELTNGAAIPADTIGFVVKFNRF
jgi:hypothetical protein